MKNIYELRKVVSVCHVTRHARKNLLLFTQLFRTWALLALILFSCKESEQVSQEGHILAFRLPVAGSVVIDENSGIISIAVPYGTLLSGLSPQISLSPEATVVPLASVPQNFSAKIYYTVSTPGGAKKVYTVVVTSQKELAVKITGFSKDTVRAGESVLVSGKEFGSFGAGITVFFRDPSGTETVIPFKLVDSTGLRLNIPVSLNPALYFVRIIKNKLETISDKALMVRIPEPEITSVKIRNILQGDTVRLAGNYIFPARYEYRLVLEVAERNYTLAPVRKENGKLYFSTDASLNPDTYRLRLLNVSEGISSKQASDPVRIYNNGLPFIKSIAEGKATYKTGETFRLNTINFEKIQARFYQVELTGNDIRHSQNGIYSAIDKQLSILLPTDIKPLEYRIKIVFLADSGTEMYSLDLDDTLIIKE